MIVIESRNKQASAKSKLLYVSEAGQKKLKARHA